MAQNTEDIIAQRRATVARLYLQGMRQADIAAKTGVTQGQISQDLTAIRAEWQESKLVDFNQLKCEELAKIDNLEATYWQAWHASTEPLKKKSTKMRGDVAAVAVAGSAKPKPQTKNVESYELTEERLGDPRYLDGVMKCIQKRVEILGLDAPLKVANTDPEGKAVLAQTIFIVDTTEGRPVPAPDEDYNAPA